jgi:hypothetical protein
MSYESHDVDFFSRLYRFAWILLMREDVARKVVMDALAEIHVRDSHSHEDIERKQARCFQVVRQRALKVAVIPFESLKGESRGWPPGTDTWLVGIVSARVTEVLHRVAEPGRSALALALLDAVDVESMQRILGLSILQLADAVDAARGAVAEHLAANEGGGL